MLPGLLTLVVQLWRVVHFTFTGLLHTFDDCMFRGRGDADWKVETEKLVRDRSNSKENGGRKRWAVVTGAAVGLGKEVVKLLARSEYNVIVACRSEARGAAAVAAVRAELKAEHPTQTPDVALVSYPCDLGDLRSVANFLKQLETHQGDITLFVGNAAVLATPYSLTPQGYIHQVGVNFHANAVLLNRVAELMKSNCGGRIVMVGSRTAFDGTIDTIELGTQANTPPAYGETVHNRYTAYGATKLAVMLYIEGLLDPLQQWNAAHPGKAVHLSVVHPGCLTTSIARSLPLNQIPGIDVLHALTTFSPAEGAYYVAKACFGKAVQGGYYHMGRLEAKPDACGDAKLVRVVAGHVEQCLKMCEGF